MSQEERLMNIHKAFVRVISLIPVLLKISLVGVARRRSAAQFGDLS